jgi:septum site-determining protein MinC
MAVSFEIKSAQLPLVALLLKTENLAAVCADLLSQFGPASENPDFFDNDALVVDASGVTGREEVSDLSALLETLRICRLAPVAIRTVSAAWLDAGKALGLLEAPPEVGRVRADSVKNSAPEKHVEIIKEVLTEVVREVPGPPTMVIDKPLRSGQKIYARGADLVVLAMVNQGAEVVADGNIHVYAPLRGKAMAGARGNTNARIFSLCLEPELISIAGIYRTSENPLPKDIQGKAAQVRLSNDGQDKLLIEALKT